MIKADTYIKKNFINSKKYQIWTNKLTDTQTAKRQTKEQKTKGQTD